MEEHLQAVQYERDEALRKAAEREAEVQRLNALVERSEAGTKQLHVRQALTRYPDIASKLVYRHI